MHTDHDATPSSEVATIGRIAPAIAHDVNNLLSGILGYSQIIISDPSAGILKSYAEEIEKAGKRISGLIRLLQVFNPGQLFHEELLDIRALSRELEKYVPRILGKDIQLLFEETAALHPVRADKTRVRQALLLWFVLLRRLLPQGGRIAIEIKNTVSASAPPEKSGPEVAICADLHSPVPFPSSFLHRMGEEIEGSLQETKNSNLNLMAVLQLCGGRMAHTLHDTGILSVGLYFPAELA